MARAVLVVTHINRDGAYVAPVAGTNQGTSFANDGRVFLEVKNASGVATRAVTIITPKEELGLALEDLVITLPISGTRLIGPFPPDQFNQSGANSGMVWVDFPVGSEADLSVSAYRF